MRKGRKLVFGNVLAFCCVWLLPAGCKPKAAPAAGPSPVVAEVGGRKITRAGFEAEAVRRRAAGRPAASAKELLDEMIEREAMLVKAEASGIATNETFQRDTESRLLSQWVASTLAKTRDNVKVTDEELKASYEERKDSAFTSAALTRLAILYRRLSGHAGGDAAQALEKSLSEGLAAFEKDRAAATNQGRLPGFGKIASDYSEDTVTRYRGGDLGWLNLEKGEHSRVPKEVLAAGAALAQGQVSVPIRAGDGIYVVMKIGERSAKQMTFHEALPMLRRRLLREKQRAAEDRFKAEVLGTVPVKVIEGEAETLTLPKSDSRSAEKSVSPIPMIPPQ
ncbi:MAG: peptidyl-prolyl cis-trans isomerase [Kiritimatiellae bacterium]|nr:peptidyl-prolyl cis-trans isomerase [Kiritimatiellia bacterium]